jgi:hypothetical protein
MQNFNKKYENENYSILYACGLATFFQIFTFIGSSVICLSLSEIPIWTHQREFGGTIKNVMDILIIRIHLATRFLQAKFRRKKCICDKCEESVNS